MENGKFQILILDDSATFVRITKDMINKHINDVNVWEAANGMEALRILGNHEIDLILLDVFMPVYDGFEMAKIIRMNDKTSKIPIIFITGSDPNKDLESKVMTLGAVDYLMKPFTDIELTRMLRLYLRFVKWEREINSKLDQKNTELKNEVEERRKIERTLLELTKKLKESNQTKDKFFSIIAHDLKNPLGAFRNVTKLLADDFEEMDKDDVLEFINLMKDSSDKLYGLLENLLQWARSQQGLINCVPSEQNLNSIVIEIIGIVAGLANDKKIKLKSNIPEELSVIADENMLKTILRNLLSNAIKFTPLGGKVWIDFERNENKVIVSVNDNGVGISAEDISKLFNIGENFTSLGTNMETGTGLGLIMCKDFMKKHGGDLWVESKVGKGSSFKFTLEVAGGVPEIML